MVARPHVRVGSKDVRATNCVRNILKQFTAFTQMLSYPGIDPQQLQISTVYWDLSH